MVGTTVSTSVSILCSWELGSGVGVYSLTPADSCC
jgi:hypothetical protein